MAASRASVLGLAVVALCATGCCDAHGSARCAGPLPEAISSITVTVRTGTDGTDANIYFCLELRTSTAPLCLDLDSPIDDFEEGDTNAFTLDVGSIERGELLGFHLENRGGGVLDNDWDMVALRVQAAGAVSGGTFPLYDEPNITCGDEEFDSGTSWYPSPCTY